MNQIMELGQDRLDDFARRLATLEQGRILQATLWGVFEDAFPHRPRGVEPRLWLLAALHDAAAREIISLPPTHGRCWEHTYLPSLPRTVRRLGGPETRPDEKWRCHPWHPLLQAWVPRLARLAPGQEAFLHRINEGLLRDWFKELAPLKYRSLQLTGHEKELGRLQRTVLFDPGRLTLQLLGCTSEVPPLVWKSVGSSTAILVFENAAAFNTASDVLSSMKSPPYGMVAFGGGNSFVRSVRYLASIGRTVGRIDYVGDLDWPGLRMAVNARRAAWEAGLPSVEPAPGMHRAMLAAALRFGHPNGMEYKAHRNVHEEEALLGWLPAEVRNEVTIILRAKRRIPEETIGSAEMHALFQNEVQP